MEREPTESSSERSPALDKFLSPVLPEWGQKMGWPFKTGSQLCGWVEGKEVAVMAKEPQGHSQTRLYSIAPSVVISVWLTRLRPSIMTSIGTGYDLSASTYSPDGRIFQVGLFESPVFLDLTSSRT